MLHNCRSVLCETPHSELDDHKDECGCIDCHVGCSHDWREWRVYPECEYCEAEMLAYWAEELKEAA